MPKGYQCKYSFVHIIRRGQELALPRYFKLLSQNITNYGELIPVQDNKNSTSRLTHFFGCGNPLL